LTGFPQDSSEKSGGMLFSGKDQFSLQMDSVKAKIGGVIQ
jgi:hypothetical protein